MHLRILMVFPFVPYPPNDGGRIGFFNPIKYISRKHEVSVVCLTDGLEQQDSIDELKTYCADLRTCRRSTGLDLCRLMKGIVRWPPGSAAKYWCKPMGALIQKIVTERQPEIVEFHHLNTAIYRGFAGATPSLLREHNVEYKVWDRFATEARKTSERVYARWSASRVRDYEANMAPKFARCLTVSEADSKHLLTIAPTAQVESIPSGVDTEYFYPCPDAAEEPYAMVLTGSFAWRPKQHNLRVLLTEIMPRIRSRVPQVTLTIVGKGVPEELRALAERTPGVEVTGTVPDVRPYVWRSSLVLNYLESGGGIALKVLEAMAMRKPVLSNSLGCEGIQATHGEHLFLADGAERFAEAAACLLSDEPVRQSLATKGHELITKTYGWASVAHRFDDCYRRIIEETRQREILSGVVHQQFA